MLDLNIIFDDDRQPGGTAVVSGPEVGGDPDLAATSGAEPIRRIPESANIQPEDLPESWRERYEERAAVREFDGGQAREHAEAEALREIVTMMHGDAPA